MGMQLRDAWRVVPQPHTTGVVGLSLPHPHRRLLPSSLSGLTTPGTSSSSRSGWHQAAAMLSHQAATGQVRGSGELWAQGWAPGHQGTGEFSVTAQWVAVGYGKTRDAMWGGDVPSAITGTVVLGGKGMRMAGDILLCCATITATITATASAPHVAPAAGAASQGLDIRLSSAKWGSPCSLLGGVHSPVIALCPQPSWQRGRCGWHQGWATGGPGMAWEYIP